MSLLFDAKRHVAGKDEAEHHDGGAQSERWLISYADLITTLMVLFLALYVLELAKSHALEVKVVEATHAAHAASTAASQPAAPAPGDAQRKELLAQLGALRAAGEISLAPDARGVEVAINAKLLFRAGDAHLLPEAYGVLGEVATILKRYASHDLLVEGHTDSTPIATSKYESNWELSSARAGAVVRYFAEHGIEPHRMAAMGRADNVPAVLGEDAGARAANRRVTIYVQY
jgi:chemotaxis protein MotB